MKLSLQQSSRFRLVSTICMISVVFIHSKFIMSRWANFVEIDSYVGQISSIIQYMISENICRVAVPIFFFISGFWAFQNESESMMLVVKKVWKGLFVPYLLFSIIGAIPYFALGSFSFNIKTVCSIFVHPIPYQFWFLQHLIILRLCIPFFVKIKRWIPLILIGLMIYWFESLHRWGGLEESILFFLFGAYSSDIKIIRKTWGYNTLFIFIILLIASIILYIQHFQFENYIIYKMMILSGVLSIVSYLLIEDDKIIANKVNGGLSFWIFAMHEPLLDILKTIYLTYFNTQFLILLGYFLLPTLVLCVCICTFFILKRLCPKLLDVCIGYRK